MHHLTSGESREDYCREDRHGCSIEDDALHGDRWIATFEPAQRLQTVTEIMTAICAGAEVVQVTTADVQGRVFRTSALETFFALASRWIWVLRKFRTTDFMNVLLAIFESGRDAPNG
jgi:hypothetical protein